MKKVIIVTMVLLLSAAALGVAFAQDVFWIEGSQRGDRPVVDVNRSFAPLAERAMPAVVTVYTRREVKTNFLFQQGSRVQEGAGSGFIISDDGYIITNYHVVKGSDKIMVAAGVDRKEEYDARLVGFDKDIDIALLKIEATGLPVLPLGDSEELQVGDWVAAIGSPFNFPHTLTVGVVSAKGRRLGLGNYDDFIQTDASINSGNSGGPLLNIYGEVVGVNTLIVSPTGTNIGIGFATPINLVKSVLVQLRVEGKVTRSWLGITISPVSDEQAKELGLDRPRGASVVQVVVGSPADKAGIEVGDVVVEWDGQAIEDSADLPRLVSSFGVGRQAIVKFYHQGELISRQVELVAMPGMEERQDLEVRGGASSANILGVGARDLTEEEKKEKGAPQGVLVVNVRPESPAATTGIQEGDIIYKINLINVNDVTDFQRAVDKLKPGDFVRISVRRGPSTMVRLFRLP